MSNNRRKIEKCLAGGENHVTVHTGVNSNKIIHLSHRNRVESYWSVVLSVIKGGREDAEEDRSQSQKDKKSA